MKITKKQWTNYQQRLNAINKKAEEEMRLWITSRGGYQAVEFEDAIAKAYELSTKYGEASASLSALMYDATAELSNASVPAATVADTASLGEVSQAILGASEFSQNDDYISGVVGRLVKQAGADTTLQNAKRDGAEFAWIPSGDTCAFCELLAAQGWQKASKEAIKGNHAEHIHANCQCAFVVRFDDSSSLQGYKPNTNLYSETPGNTMEEKANAIRRQNYAANKDEINAQKRITYAKKQEERNSSTAEEEATANFGETYLPIK